MDQENQTETNVSTETRNFAESAFNSIWTKEMFTFLKGSFRYDFKYSSKNAIISNNFTDSIGKAVHVSRYFLCNYFEHFFNFVVGEKSIFKREVKLMWLHWLQKRSNVFVKVVDTLAIITEILFFANAFSKFNVGRKEMSEWFIEWFEEHLASDFFKRGGWKVLNDTAAKNYDVLFNSIHGIAQKIRTFNYVDHPKCKFTCSVIKALRSSPIKFPVQRYMLCEKCRLPTDDQNLMFNIIYIRLANETAEKLEEIGEDEIGLADVELNTQTYELFLEEIKEELTMKIYVSDVDQDTDETEETDDIQKTDKLQDQQPESSETFDVEHKKQELEIQEMPADEHFQSEAHADKQEISSISKTLEHAKKELLAQDVSSVEKVQFEKDKETLQSITVDAEVPLLISDIDSTSNSDLESIARHMEKLEVSSGSQTLEHAKQELLAQKMSSAEKVQFEKGKETLQNISVNAEVSLPISDIDSTSNLNRESIIKHTENLKIPSISQILEHAKQELLVEKSSAEQVHSNEDKQTFQSISVVAEEPLAISVVDSEPSFDSEVVPEKSLSDTAITEKIQITEVASGSQSTEVSSVKCASFKEYMGIVDNLQKHIMKQRNPTQKIPVEKNEMYLISDKYSDCFLELLKDYKSNLLKERLEKLNVSPKATVLDLESENRSSATKIYLEILETDPFLNYFIGAETEALETCKEPKKGAVEKCAKAMAEKCETIGNAKRKGKKKRN